MEYSFLQRISAAFNPAPAGGVEQSFAEVIETWIEIAWQDGSFGWIGIANLPTAVVPREEATVNAGWSADVPEGACPPRRGVAGRPRVQHGRGGRRLGDDLTPTLRADMRVAAVCATDTVRNCAIDVWLGISDDQFGL